MELTLTEQLYNLQLYNLILYFLYKNTKVE